MHREFAQFGECQAGERENFADLVDVVCRRHLRPFSGSSINSTFPGSKLLIKTSFSLASQIDNFVFTKKPVSTNCVHVKIKRGYSHDQRADLAIAE